MSEEVIYECVSCGHRAPKSEWQRLEYPGHFKCPNCGKKTACKTRPPVVRRVKAI